MLSAAWKQMNLEEYKKLCQVCDRILTSNHATIISKCIPWLHILNAHPTTQQKYMTIWGKKNRHVSIFRHTIKFLFNIIIGRSLPEYLSSYPENKKTDILIISHLINKNQFGKNKDFYFGNIALDLKQEGITSQIVLINHLGSKRDNLINSWSKKSIPRIFLANRLNIKKEIILLYRLSREAYRLFKCSLGEKNSFTKKIYKAASKAAISTESINSLRFSYQVENLIKKLEPSAIFTTMEGHAFERLAFYAARQINPEIKCLGYQHAVLFPHQHSIKRSLGPDFDPDIIFTAGSHTINTLQKGYKRQNVKFINIGTHRYASPKSIYNVTKLGHGLDCLVLPDGNIAECLSLCKFALQAAEQLKNIKFVIRLHPLNSIQMLIAKDKAFKKLPTNLSFSDNEDIQNDFKKSRWALYRGSGAAIHSALAGCRPIYVTTEGAISIDPLYQINSGRMYAKNFEGLQKILMNDYFVDHEIFIRELEPLFEYCKKYFTVSNTQNLINEVI